MGKKASPETVSSVLIAKASVDLDKIVADELLVDDPTEVDIEDLIDENTDRNDRTASSGSN